VFHNTLAARPLFVDYAGAVAIKLDAGDLAIVLAIDYFFNNLYFRSDVV
jgi:predicted ATP-dependent serine protease